VCTSALSLEVDVYRFALMMMVCLAVAAAGCDDDAGGAWSDAGSAIALDAGGWGPPPSGWGS